MDRMFAEFRRILKDQGRLLVAVIKGTAEGIIDDAWYEGNSVYFTHFTEDEIRGYFDRAGFRTDLPETRKPCDFEITVDRIYAIGKKTR